MHPHEILVLYLGLHQAVLVVFSIWHFCYYCSIEQYNFGIGGFFIGFPIHSMILMSWYLLKYSPNICFWMFAVTSGSVGWLLSWCLMVSLDHWSVTGFLLISLLLPLFVAYVSIKKKNHKIILKED